MIEETHMVFSIQGDLLYKNLWYINALFLLLHNKGPGCLIYKFYSQSHVI
jgi:hypothetical protein